MQNSIMYLKILQYQTNNLAVSKENQNWSNKKKKNKVKNDSLLLLQVKLKHSVRNKLVVLNLQNKYPIFLSYNVKPKYL